jgi:hypothetical protein
MHAAAQRLTGPSRDSSRFGPALVGTISKWIDCRTERGSTCVMAIHSGPEWFTRTRQTIQIAAMAARSPGVSRTRDDANQAGYVRSGSRTLRAKIHVPSSNLSFKVTPLRGAPQFNR